MMYPGIETIFYCLGAKPKDKLLILTDEKIKECASIIQKAYKGDSEIDFLPLEEEDDIPEDLHDEMQEYNIILIIASQSWYHTPTRRKAKYEWDKRIATCKDLTLNMLESGALCADYDLVERLTKELSRYYEDKEGIHITTQRGTDISADITGRKCYYETGLYTRPGTGGNIPAGELPVSPIEGTANGTMVYDINFAGIDEFFPPLAVDIRKGKVTGICGDNAKDLYKLIDEHEQLRYLVELSLGTNPYAIITGRPIVEQEKKLRAGHGGFGLKPHRDGIFWEPTLILEGKEKITIMQDGKIPKELISDDLVKWLSEYDLVI